MHEFSIVQQLIEKLQAELGRQNVTVVKKVHLRRGSTFAEEPLRQAFQILSENTPLQNAELVIEEFAVEFACASCGHKQAISADDLIGHLFLCPQCGKPTEIEEAHGLELLAVEY